MCEWMFGGMCAGVVCEDMLLCTSVLRSSNCTLDGVSGNCPWSGMYVKRGYEEKVSR